MITVSHPTSSCVVVEVELRLRWDFDNLQNNSIFLLLYQDAVIIESESSHVVKMSAAHCATLVSLK